MKTEGGSKINNRQIIPARITTTEAAITRDWEGMRRAREQENIFFTQYEQTDRANPREHREGRKGEKKKGGGGDGTNKVITPITQ